MLKKRENAMKTLRKVESSMVSALGYNPPTKELKVVFHTGITWIYKDIPQKVYDNLIKSHSIGMFMIRNIIDCYKERRLN